MPCKARGQPRREGSAMPNETGIVIAMLARSQSYTIPREVRPADSDPDRAITYRFESDDAEASRMDGFRTGVLGDAAFRTFLRLGTDTEDDAINGVLDFAWAHGVLEVCSHGVASAHND